MSESKIDPIKDDAYSSAGLKQRVSIQDHLLSSCNVITHLTNQEHILVYKQQSSGRSELPARLQLQLCAPPVSPLGVVADGVSSSHSRRKTISSHVSTIYEVCSTFG